MKTEFERLFFFHDRAQTKIEGKPFTKILKPESNSNAIANL